VVLILTSLSVLASCLHGYSYKCCCNVSSVDKTLL
jgi:hypothetical protein